LDGLALVVHPLANRLAPVEVGRQLQRLQKNHPEHGIGPRQFRDAATQVEKGQE
jgi:hypothetical protein